jgi:diguanylate cyclase (GGDEF)-like protein
MFDHLTQAARGTYWNTPGQTSSIRTINGTKRLVSYATVDGFPLIASLGRTETEIFRSARADALIYWLIALLVTGCIAVAIAYGARRQRKLDEAAASLERTNARFSLALENMPHGLCMYDSKQRLVIANRRYAEIYRLPTDAIVPGTPLDRILRLRVAGASDGLTERYLRQQSELAASRTPSAVESALNGRTYLVTHQPTADGGALAIHQDVTEQKAAETQIWELAHRDSLTGVTSRLAFLETLRTVIGPQGARPRELAVHIVDIDNFKDINDSLGHPVGDSLLAQIAGRIKSAAGPNVIVGRLGGDEFALLQNPSGAIAREAPLLADRVLAAIRRPYNIDDRLLHVEASIGIAVAPADGSDADRLIKRADLALYNVKAAGRNGYRVFEASMESAVEERLHLTTELRQALVQQEFELDYQPVVALDTRATVSREALLRWNHPLRGRLLPETFIGTAEHSGLIKAIGSWVLHSACREAMRWPDHTRVAVNLSPIQFRDSLFEVVENALRESGLPPQRLELEVTENVLLEYNEQNIRCLDRLRSLGVAIVLDDFGAGYASLGYLRRFRFDRIKIDRSITTGLSREPDLYGILSAITGLARALDVKTIAEGIETEEQLLLLRAAGCDEGQGFLLGRPGPVSASVRRIA